ncbi:MAG TPA: hypothetical protein VNH64_11740 [Parvularculaceae bacterium]|nr:hypothetical protein [Parvularculaceae bacterium]
MTRRIGAFALAAGLALLLTGCLVSEKPLLDEHNGRATPIAAGDYNACKYYDQNGGAPECSRAHVAFDKTGLYSIKIDDDGDDDDKPLSVRFRRLGGGAWLAQLGETSDTDNMYYIAEVEGDDFIMALINCEDLPEALRDKYVARGEMKVDTDATIHVTTCTANTLGAVAAAAKAFRDGAPISMRARIVFRRLAAAD